MKKDNTKLSEGFTLIEALVAIAILLIAVVGPMSVIGGSLSQASTTRDQLIAINLAQEGIEVVRQKRDSNMLACWGSFTSPCSTWAVGIAVGNYAVVSVDATPISLCSPAPGLCTTKQKLVRQDAAGWYYQGVGGTPTKFSRVVNISDVPLSAEKIITSTVTWSVGGAPKSVEVKESIFGISS